MALLDGAAPTAFLSKLLLQVAEEPVSEPASEPASGSATAGSSTSAAGSTPSPSANLSGKQVSLGTFFGAGTKRTFERLPNGQRVLSLSANMSATELAAISKSNAGYCAKGCGRFAFANAGARATHKKSCKGLALGGAGAAAAANASASAASHTEVATSAVAAAASRDADKPGGLDDADLRHRQQPGAIDESSRERVVRSR